MTCLICNANARKRGGNLCSRCRYPRGTAALYRITAEHESLFVLENQRELGFSNWLSIGTYETYQGALAGFWKFLGC